MKRKFHLRHGDIFNCQSSVIDTLKKYPALCCSSEVFYISCEIEELSIIIIMFVNFVILLFQILLEFDRIFEKQQATACITKWTDVMPKILDIDATEGGKGINCILPLKLNDLNPGMLISL